ncbi:uncharacterized protein LOC106064832 [Biomphalaria glabrata]|uniref:Uncharacterized protein LOC106064832 n=1 Tax=Biomphalaria glabrata TaxID=6526 RepID=A0A9W2ZFC3_BIOGL|nr:uncharacterized protein LOC106064832 [Biomphalaria glabrata]
MTRQNIKLEIEKSLDVETFSAAKSLGATPEFNIENIINEKRYLKGDFLKIYPLLRKGQEIGIGGTGHVYKLIEDSKTEVEYVVKEICLPAEHSEKLLKIFYREVEVLRGLPDHRRIIQFFGYCVSELYCSLYLAYMKLGCISEALREGPFTEEKCFLYTGQILEGLEFLHNKGVIHRDIKGPNVLLEDENNIRITDFGLAKFMDGSENTMELGTCRWMAPEVVNRKPDMEPYNFKADIWSVGCTALEMITAKVPFHDRSNIANIIFTLHNGESPKLPNNISERMERFLKQTFVLNHKERFSAGKLIEEFFAIESQTEDAHCNIGQTQEVFFSEAKEITRSEAEATHEIQRNRKSAKHGHLKICDCKCKDCFVYFIVVVLAIIFFPISICYLIATRLCTMKSSTLEYTTTEDSYEDVLENPHVSFSEYASPKLPKPPSTHLYDLESPMTLSSSNRSRGHIAAHCKKVKYNRSENRDSYRKQSKKVEFKENRNRNDKSRVYFTNDRDSRESSESEEVEEMNYCWGVEEINFVEDETNTLVI